MARFTGPDTNNPTTEVWGVVLGVTPSDPSYEFEFERAPDNGSGSPDTGSAVSLGQRVYAESGDVLVDQVPNDGAPRHYRNRAVVPGGGTWTNWLAVVPFPLPPEYLTPRSSVYPLKRGKALDDGGYAALADDAIGVLLNENVAQDDGVSARTLARGYIKGIGQHGDAIVFPTAFQSPPMILLRGGIGYEPRSGQWSPSYDAAKPQYRHLAALDLTAAGFTLVAQLRQKGAQTPQTDDFGALNVLDALGETTEATLSPGGAAADTYLLRFGVLLRITCALHVNQSGSVTVAIDTDDGGGWVERAAYTYNGTAIAGDCSGAYEEFSFGGESKTLVVSGLGASDKVRLRIKSVTGSVYEFQVHGWVAAEDGTAGVSYQTATDAYASMTPDAEDTVEWEAIAVS